MPTGSSVGAAIAGISSMATRHMLAELADLYRQQSGGVVTIESVGGVDAARRVQAGEALDFVVLASDAIERLISSGRVLAASRTDFARSPIAVAIAAGAARPDIGSESAVRETVLRARTIGCSTGPSGAHLARLFERWGIRDAIAARIVQPPPGTPVATLVARGEVDIAFQQLSELMDVPGVDVAGPLPPAIQSVTVFTAAACVASQKPQPAASWLAFLASPANDAVKRRHGMEPA